MKVTAQLLAAAISFSSFLPTDAKMQRASHRHLARAQEKRDNVAYAALMYWGHQDGNKGSCGEVHSDDQPLVGLATAMYGKGDQCGKYVEIKNTANNMTVTAPVYDSCDGCSDKNDLVSSIATFEGLGGNLDDGILEVVWTFIDAPEESEKTLPKVVAKPKVQKIAKPAEEKPAAKVVKPEKKVEAPAQEAAPAEPEVQYDDCEEYEPIVKEPIVKEQVEQPQLKAEDEPEAKAPEAKELKVEAAPEAAPIPQEKKVAVKAKVAAAPSAEGFKMTHNLQGQELLFFFHMETATGDNEGFAAWVDDGSLQYVNGQGNVVFATEDTPTVDARKTTRAVSNERFSKGLFISRITHMPSTYGSWPSFWIVGAGSWPQTGEIDVLEGVGSFTHNAASVHTSAGCSMPKDVLSQTTSKFMLDAPEQTNCDALATDTQGCGLRDDTPNTFGPGFNSVGGAYVAVLITDDVIKIHQWPGDSAPADVKNNAPAPSTWGTPSLVLPSTQCNIGERFTDLQLVFSTNVCGRWPSDLWHKDAAYAGQKQSSAQATGVDSCYEWAHNHGKAWADAYFEIASISIFQ